MTQLTKLVLFLGDLIFLNVSIILCFYLLNVQASLAENLNFIYLIIFSNLSWIFLVAVSNPYGVTKAWSLSKILYSQSAFAFIHLLIVISLVVFFKKSYSFKELLLLYVIFLPVFFIWKLIFAYIRRILIQEIKYRNYLLVGRNRLSEGVRRYFLVNYQEGYRFKGYLSASTTQELMEKIKSFCSNQEIHEIHYCLQNASASQLHQIVNFGLDSLIKVKLITEGDSLGQPIELSKYDQNPGFNIPTVALDEGTNQLLKRIFDLFFSSLFLVLIFSWLYPLIALFIKINSQGPILFVQKRGGMGNRPFNCLKFRTMTYQKNAEFKQATVDDVRITRVGRFLRKSSIDEFPQFINVFLGEMSLIGPRPHPLKLNEDFAKRIKILMSRHYVKPGITGLAQCMGYRGETRDLADMENRVRLDRHYIENWTFWLDIKIIFLTVVSLIRGSDKAY